MTPAPTIGWFGRTFGWRGNRSQWLSLLGVLVWLAGLVYIGYKSQVWSIGQSLLAASAWVFVLGLAARDAVRDLFGPVFFYDLLRVSRNRTTFVLRTLYVIGIGLLLALLYFDWLLDNGQRDNRTKGEMALAGAVVTALVAALAWRESKGKFAGAMRAFIAVGGCVLFAILMVTALAHLFDNAIGTRYVGELIPPSRYSKFATFFFQWYVCIQFIIVALLTPVYVAGTIAVEKERKTLEFLFATDLRNREIIFGKLAARVLTLVMYVLAGLPLLALVQLFGGIDPEQLLAATSAAVFLTVGLSAVSIHVSTSLKRARDAIVLSYLVVVVYLLVSWILAILVSIPFGSGWWNTPFSLGKYSLAVSDFVFLLADGNPIWAITRLSARGVMGGTGLVDVLRDFIIFWTVASFALLCSSIFRLRRVALAQSYGPVKQKSLFIHPKAKATDKRREVRDRDFDRPPVGDNPVLWKEVFVDSTFKGGCLGRMVGGIILALVFVSFGIIVYQVFFDSYRTWSSNSGLWEDFSEAVNVWARIVTGVLGTLMFISATMRGASAISGEKDKDCWISLMGTPMSAEEILIGKFWGCVLSLRRAFAVMLLVWAMALCCGAINPLMMIVMLFLTAVYVSAFSWVGLYCSMTARNSLVASIRAFFGGLFCAGGFWAALGLCCFLPVSWVFEASYTFSDQLLSFFCGFTPPIVYGVFPLHNFEADQLGPFNGEHTRSAGLIGPIIGTTFWIVFSLLMKLACESKLREIMNRSPQEPRPAPREKTSTLAQS
ncbi:hypothetical protein BH11PLA2_BH11PLA2_00260 [soil metagenome]